MRGFRSLSEALFWNAYAVCYDSISRLKPYQELQGEILRESELRAGQSLLDAGCGTGNFLRLLAKSQISCLATAVDASQIMLARARKKCEKSAIHWLNLDLNHPLPFPDLTFDRVVCANVIFALENPRDFLWELHRVLKPEGRLVLSTPQSSFNTNLILRAHLQTLRTWKDRIAFSPWFIPLGAATLINLLARRRARGKTFHFFTRESLEELFARTPFAEIKIEPVYANQAWLAVARKGGLSAT